MYKGGSCEKFLQFILLLLIIFTFSGQKTIFFFVCGAKKTFVILYCWFNKKFNFFASAKNRCNSLFSLIKNLKISFLYCWLKIWICFACCAKTYVVLQTWSSLTCENILTFWSAIKTLFFGVTDEKLVTFNQQKGGTPFLWCRGRNKFRSFDQ